MTAPKLISGLAELADRYDVLLSDVWGVIHNGRESFPAANAVNHDGPYVMKKLGAFLAMMVTP